MFKYTPNRAEGANIFGCFGQKVSFCPPLFGRFTEQGGAKTQGYDMIANLHRSESIRKIVCLGFACKITAGARSDTHGLVRDFSGDHTKVFKVRLRRD